MGHFIPQFAILYTMTFDIEGDVIQVMWRDHFTGTLWRYTASLYPVLLFLSCRFLLGLELSRRRCRWDDTLGSYNFSNYFKVNCRMPNKGHFGLKSLVSRHIEENLNNTMSFGDPFSDWTIALIRLFSIQDDQIRLTQLSSMRFLKSDWKRHMARYVYWYRAYARFPRACLVSGTACQADCLEDVQFSVLLVSSWVSRNVYAYAENTHRQFH